jgi:hypothetical protein
MKRIALIAVPALLTGAVTIGSLLLTPAATQSRLTAVPAHAHVVYSNKDPDWFLSFFPTLGKTNDEFSNAWKESFQPLETAPLIVATVPFAGREQRDTWVAVSELGGPAATALRWRLSLFPPKGVSPARSFAVWPVWKFEHPSLPSWARVRFSITESLLICTVSADSHDIYRVLDVADGRSVSLVK